MKLSTTTPGSASRVTKIGIILTTALVVVALPIQMAQKSFADQYDDQINAIQTQINAAQAQSAALAQQASTYQSAIAQLQAQVATIQGQIDLSQTQYDQLQSQIADTQTKIKDTQNALGDIIASMYVDSDITPLEMLASSKNIADYLDKQEYKNSVSSSLTSKITQIKTLQATLTKQKTQVESVLANQTASRNALSAAQQQQQTLFDQTQGQEAAYQALVASNQTKQQQIRDEQNAAIAAKIKATGGATLIKGGSAGDYPWNASNCPVGADALSYGGSDGNGGDGHGYGCRQCASYAAWRVAKETGMYPTNWGNAKDFPASATGVFSEGTTPRAGSLAVMTPAQAGGPNGHIAWVEAVNDDGTITVSQYNYNYGAGWGLYSEMKLSSKVFSTYIYVK